MSSGNTSPYFRNNVPEWLKYIALITMLVPTVMVFSAATVGLPQAMNFYGISANDVQFGIVIFYAVVVSYAPLGAHFFRRLPTVTYLWISVILQSLTLYGAYKTRSFEVLIIMRFLNSIFNTGINNISLDLLFGKMKSNNAREVGYGAFYGLVLAAGALGSWLGSVSFSNHEIANFYKLTIFSFLPGTIMLTLILRNVPLVPVKLVRFFEMGWSDFIYFSIVLISLGYMLIYGQELNYFEHPHMRMAALLSIVFSLLELLRLKYSATPYMNFNILRSANFRFGILLLIALYFIRGAFNLTLAYFSEVLDGPFEETNQLVLCYNILGVVIGSILSTFMIIRHYSLRLIWIIGLLIMLCFYAVMSTRFNVNANISDYWILLIVQGMGQGLLMSPIIQFYISSVPPTMAGSAGGFGVMMRFLFFSASLALINFTQARSYNEHQQILGNNLTNTNHFYNSYLSQEKANFLLKGIPAEKANAMANAALHQRVHKELFVEYAQNYYQGISLLIISIIILIICRPAINKTIINLKNKQPFGAGF